MWTKLGGPEERESLEVKFNEDFMLRSGRSLLKVQNAVDQ